jgi:arginine exporter protein ArgO
MGFLTLIKNSKSIIAILSFVGLVGIVWYGKYMYHDVLVDEISSLKYQLSVKQGELNECKTKLDFNTLDGYIQGLEDDKNTTVITIDNLST